MIWDKELDALASKIANRNRVPKEQVKEMVEHVMKCTRRALYDPTMPKILIHKFGVFKVKSQPVLSKLKSYKRMLNAGKITQERYDELEIQLTQNSKRIQNEGR